MPADNTEHSDTGVIVVGAGPTGLLLAGDLAAAGIPVALVERHEHGSELTRAFVVHARTLELFDQRGIAETLVSRGRQVTALRLFDKAVVDMSRLPGRYPYMLATPQYETEGVLLRRARDAGVQFVRPAELTGLMQDTRGVTATLADGRTIRASYLVGTDGHRSTVRQLLGEPFPGRSVVKSVMLADVLLKDEPPGGAATNSIGDRFTFIVPFGDGYYRVISWDRSKPAGEHDPVDIEELKDIARSVLGTDFGMYGPRWSSRFHSDERQVRRYRVGRVFLAGDAAHVHSPAGGQGMNTGLQDAANLSWKLASALTGGPDLLDSYEAERRPVGAKVIKGSGALLRLAMLHSTAARTARNEIVSAALHVPLTARRLPLAISGLWVKYPAPKGAHPLVGARAQDARLRGESARLFGALRAGRFVLLDVGGLHEREAVDVAATGRLDLVVGLDPDAPSMLVRPDGHVAWAADPEFPDPKGLRRALREWVTG
ncbi:FAD-dependent monooxygenase [Actinospica sp.]|uniref:FAD-dependent monooxygenase n=1 Tax=Actinospica sp. TaxID=1872142 RepID=UPI002CEDF76C|nr:FAD-dependent monooxygenase [Actinospica sp.]HWG25288.1 FAD-dependent monooxygenase [Actinospica sp.]